MAYSEEREAFGQSINGFQGISFKLADMITQIEAARHLVYHAAWKKDQGKSVIHEASMAKLFSSEMAMNITTEAIQIFGGYGYIKEYDVERFFSWWLVLNELCKMAKKEHRWIAWLGILAILVVAIDLI